MKVIGRPAGISFNGRVPQHSVPTPRRDIGSPALPAPHLREQPGIRHDELAKKHHGHFKKERTTIPATAAPGTATTTRTRLAGVIQQRPI